MGLAACCGRWRRRSVWAWRWGGGVGGAVLLAAKRWDGDFHGCKRRDGVIDPRGGLDTYLRDGVTLPGVSSRLRGEFWIGCS